ncbi:hypothetical protein EPA93_37705 [Ktedonosporobacter rubrisoli]|uniref:CR-type domain-containing protein n=1 Tax=Ktedonosporobacter rubrisoli TaxID=2509675 RepID=A0A4P6K052_KTERU|nr:hypothetical protein [Ktedonosporobacter rubrisoli]QBD81404.1 hypothetical protein EPA93_37705 [Ktedonosporobacter rubrisoli]
MGDEYQQDPGYRGGQPNQPNFEDIDKRVEDIKRLVVSGASEAQQRLKRVVSKANDYWQQAQVTPTPKQASSIEEQRIRQLANQWSYENWRVARDLGTYMDLISWGTDEVWEVTIETRWETRGMEQVTEPYKGRATGIPKPLLPVWDYELPAVTGLKAPTTHTRLEGLDEVVACTACNGTGHVLCANCNGRGWIVCPDCKGRTKKRCSTCRGRGYVADWSKGEKKPFFQRQAENVASSVGNKVSDVFDNIRQQGVPIPNPVENDPAAKGPTVPCPDCIKGEVDCTCGNGKRVCTACQGAKMSLCSNCGGTGKLIRHREIVRRFDLRTQTRIIGECSIPSQQLLGASGDLIYNAEINEPLYVDAPPDGVPMDVWSTAVELVNGESQVPQKPGGDQPSSSQATLQVIELVRIPYTKVQYAFAGQEYTLYVYDSEGKEKFYADRYPVRWDRIERLFKAISNDLLAPAQPESSPYSSNQGYRVPIEIPSYEAEDDEEHPGNPPRR